MVEVEKVTAVEAKGLEVVYLALSGGGYLSRTQIIRRGQVGRRTLNRLVRKGYLNTNREGGVVLYGFTEEGRRIASDGVLLEFFTE